MEVLIGPIVQRASHQRVAIPRPLWLAVGVAFLATIAIVALIVRTILTAPFVDFEGYYAAATALRVGEPLYGRAAAYRDAGYSLDHPHILPPVLGMPYVYPPGLAVALMPLSILPFEIASRVWFVVVVGCLAGAAYVLTGLLLPIPRSYRLAAALTLCALLAYFQPTRANLVTGQVEIPLFLLLTLTLAAFARSHHVRAGILLAIATAVKPTLGFLILFLLWKRAYRAAMIAGALAACLVAAPALLLGPGVLWDFVAVAGYWTRSPWAAGPVNQSPYGLLLRLFTVNPYTTPVIESPVLASVLRWTVVGLVLIATARSVRRDQQQPRHTAMLEAGLVVVAMLLVAPLTQDIYCIHLAIPLLSVGAAVVQARPPRSLAVLLGIATAALYLFLSLPSLRLASHAFYLAYEAPLTGSMLLLTGAYTYALTMMFGLMLVAVHWDRRRRLRHGI